MFSPDLQAIIILYTPMNLTMKNWALYVLQFFISLLPGSEFIGLLLHGFFFFGAECSQTSGTDNFWNDLSP
jgi:hypothetical protein